MCKCGDANQAAKDKPKTEACEITTKCASASKFEIVSVKATIAAPDNRVYMNIPANKVLVTALVTYKESTAVDALDTLPGVVFSFNDPAPPNTAAIDSHLYDGSHRLGKCADPAAVYWEAHAEHPASSTNSYKASAKAATKPIAGKLQVEAKIWLKPSGVGGDDFEVIATVFKPDGTTEIAHDQTPTVTVWREISFNAYEMTGQTHVSTHGTTAAMSAYYTADTYVRYSLGTVTTLDAAHSVTYIGLWNHGSGSQLVWATHSAKTAAETPTADETTRANATPPDAAARAAIQAKANAWYNRIQSACYSNLLSGWATDAGVPASSVVAIEHLHPKFSAGAPNSDATTNEWSAFSWLRIVAPNGPIHPDQRWANWQGISYGQRAYITAGLTAARFKVVIAHEAGHETKNHFKRKDFGSGDHSAAAGLMDPTGSLSAFTVDEMKTLRGFK